MIIRPYLPEDRAAVWGIIEPAIRAGETLAMPQNMTETEAIDFWTGSGREAFVAEEEGEMIGTSYVRPNQMGGGSHVANGGYVTAEFATGRGVARELCAHSLEHARDQGYTAMQFNFVVSTNTRAVKLWQSFGFEIVGRLPGAFWSPTAGYVDAYVMYLVL